jgi:hypothetical protein
MLPSAEQRQEDTLAHTLTADQLRALARLGAAVRLTEIAEEAAAVRAAFPALGSPTRRRRPRRRVRAAAARPAKPTARTAPKPRTRPKMSAAVRKAVSERMRKYWAGRRQAKLQAAAKKAEGPAESPQASEGTTVQQAPTTRKVRAKPRATKRLPRKSRKARR